MQALPYILGGISEIFAIITSLEYAFMKAPTNMRVFMQAVALFMNAFSAAFGQARLALVITHCLFGTILLLLYLLPWEG